MQLIRVMIAEDFQLLREDLYELVESQNDMTVVGTAASGQEIIELSRKTLCDVFLMDIEMETVNAGILAAEEILKEKPDQNIIFLTVHETENMIFSAMGTGAVDYVIKGGYDADLLEHIRRAYAGKPVMEGQIQAKILREYSRLRRSERSLLFFINNISQLTPAERELVRFLLQGKKPGEIAQIRCVELVTVKTQIKSMLKKFGCSRTKEVVKMIEDLNISNLF
ncbi:Two component system, signal transduction response regulator [Acididesulfobacillus acetoxydans]|uniref:Stage 0 sporulation protein A homolog n=1 Tax=Acididesulfobacillus acetoxydans TaxID=1561005 RepID=A0A8S0W7G9_9FIRM|nr:response regulator transcription factor [Acididesulfobacillus acetoxydans]CAA7600749.1 Two component system, signal transduction response regulator [Acididesulfobacillus acetoxydans]CEJ07989.1 Response regulator receiver domain protein [Acididesulfobacillus acetoxydans]